MNSLRKPIRPPVGRGAFNMVPGAIFRTLAQQVAVIFQSNTGYQGVPSNVSSLFQDSAGTTPVTAVEQPVGRMVDQSGSGNTVVQATVGARPIYRKDSGSYDCLAFDGTLDFLSSPTGGGGTAGFFFCCAVLPDSVVGVKNLFCDRDTVASGYEARIGDGRIQLIAGNGTSFSALVGDLFTEGVKTLLTFYDDGAVLSVQVNAGTPTTMARPAVAAANTSFSICRDLVTPSNPYPGNLYAPVYVKNSGLTATQRATIQAYVRQQAGL